MFCPKCGSKLNGNEDFCSNCGNKMQEAYKQNNSVNEVNQPQQIGVTMSEIMSRKS